MNSAVPVFLGPTCSWKSAAALEFSRRHNGELISCDSMQVFREIEIGTAQPSPEETAEVRHHLVAFLDFSQRWDASRFVPAAQEAIREIQSRGKQPVIAGGTGMYAKALCYAMTLLPSDRELAAQLAQRCETQAGVAALRKELAEALGPLPQDLMLNPRHLARAAEVWKLTGEAPWKLRASSPQPLPEYRQVIVLPETALLKERIRRRTAKMLAAGWQEEAHRAVAAGLLQGPTAWQALGYREIAEFEAAGEPGGEAALLELLANRTMRYARRQLTWFKHQHPGAVFVRIDEEAGALDKILSAAENAVFTAG